MLIGLLVVLIIAFASITISYGQKYQENQTEIEKNQILLQSLQTISQTESEKTPEDDLLQKKSFASYEEVIPFIAFLESLFTIIDPDAEVIIKSRENQIFIDHFANYTVKLEINGHTDLLYKAIDELGKSRFIINILNFNMDYKPIGEEAINQLDEVELAIRLFLK